MTSPVSVHAKGSGLIRYAMALASARGMVVDAAHDASRRWGAFSEAAKFTRAAVAAGSTTPTGDWGNDLVDWSTASAEFFGLVAERTVLGRLTNLRRVPVLVRTVIASSGATANWVGERQPVPCSTLGFSDAPLAALKVAALVIISNELARSSNPRAETVIRADLARACRLTLDRTFLGDGAGTVDVEPAGLLHNVVATPATGTTAGDVRALIAAFPGSIEDAYFIGSGALLAGLSSLEFPGIGARGGELSGVPALASSAAGDRLILIDPTAVAVTDDTLSIAVSSEGTVELDSTPTGGAIAQVSLWQSNLSAVRATLPCNWFAARPAVAYIDYAGA